MGLRSFSLIALAALVAGLAGAQSPPDPGPVDILPLAEVEPGMQAVAWTAFNGEGAEPVPLEILGVMRNAWGPRQDIILAKMGGKAARTNVAGGMSGSPVYYDGRLLGAVSLRFSTFSPDAIAGITPIELMLEIDEFDRSRPVQASAPAEKSVPADAPELAQAVWANREAELETLAPPVGAMTVIETPLAFSGMHPGVIDVFAGHFRAQGVPVAAGGAAAARNLETVDPAGRLRPGEPIAVVLMSGDMSATALGTTSYNDGEKVLGFGHPMFNSGPISAPIATAEVIHVLASQLNPVKIANASSIVGALRQDRHSGILGALGETAEMIPAEIRVRSFDDEEAVISTKDLRFQILQNEKWTPQLLMMALFNSMFGMNDFAEEATFRLDAKFNVEGAEELSFRTMQTVTGAPLPAPLLLAGSVASRLNRLFTNTRETPRIENMNVEIDLLPKRRVASIEQVWLDSRRARPGQEIGGKVIVQPYRGKREERDFRIRIPDSAPKGRLVLMVSDSSAYNRRRQAAAARNRSLSLPETVSLLNQERANDRIYIALTDRAVSASLDDRSLPNAPLTALNVMRPSAQGRLQLELGAPLAETSIALDSIVQGSRALALEIQ